MKLQALVEDERVWQEDLEVVAPYYGVEDVPAVRPPAARLFLGNGVVIAITLGILLNAALRAVLPEEEKVSSEGPVQYNESGEAP